MVAFFIVENYFLKWDHRTVLGKYPVISKSRE